MLSTLLRKPETPTAFLKSSNPELRRLTVQASEDSVEIEGSVSSYYLKQLAQEMLRPDLAGRRILNRVVVARDDY